MKKSIVTTARIAALLLFIQLYGNLAVTAQYVAQFSDNTHFMFRFANTATAAQIDSLKTELSATELVVLPVTQVRLWEIPDSVVASHGGPLGIRNHGVGKTYVISTDPNYRTENPSNNPESSPGGGSGFPGCSGLGINCPFGPNPVTVSIHDTGYDGAPVKPTNHIIYQNLIWENAPESGAGRNNFTDDDSNGYMDDQYGWDFVSGTSEPIDRNDHGTHVTGIAAQILLAGNATDVHLMPLQALDQTGIGNLWNLVQSVDYALAKGVKVMNMSIAYIGVPGPKPSVLEWVFDFAKTYTTGGALFVVAAGNDGINLDTVSGMYRFYPAQFASDNMIVVAAENCTGSMPSFSNRGVNTVDITAPGVDIYSTITNNNYAWKSGTSMSAPFVSVAAARYGSLMPVFDWNIVKDDVINNSVTLGTLIDKVALGKSLRFCGPSLMPAHQNTGHQFAFAEDILIAPNPSSGDVTVELQEIQTVPGVLIVRNAVGQLISHTEIPAGTSSLVVSSNLWPRGIYQMSVRQGTINKTKMLIRE